jgi:hypothetical protein
MLLNDMSLYEIAKLTYANVSLVDMLPVTATNLFVNESLVKFLRNHPELAE